MFLPLACHWMFPLMFPSEHAPLMGIACTALSSLGERQGIETRCFIVLRRARPWSVTAVSTLRLPTHAHLNPQPTGQIAVCRGTGRR